MKIQIAIVYFVARHANEQARSGSARIGEEPARIGIALARHMRAARGRSTPDSPVDRSGAPRADERYASARARDTRDACGRGGRREPRRDRPAPKRPVDHPEPARRYA
ncbi:hypothetical protein GTC3P0254_03050 [Burkholderia pseudomallei]|nr:hypothetical protein [Burkholderia pseudomallei]BEH20189.1 hypothetical protein GTC019_33670 [Burkholderia pseudomallei]BEH38236.1 hypothetical protein GTC254T_33310 [Burkholderia pseudomallei]BEH44233.1 hypothetical protein KNG_34340 [Burkholderia pseudomallei]BEH56156.1 hypothetical protein BpKM376_33350 [Burkholderia pseudomallei]BEH68306.1 hypothetical protein BpKM391_33810 [Burkholderia pseudomallei]